MSNNPNLPGYGAEVFTSESAEMEAILQAMLMNVRTALPVRVEGVTNSGGVSPIGYVNIRPLVKLIDASSNTTSHRVIYNVPYLRIQGGANAVILDPQVGDIGMATFSDRDISTVKATKQEGPPGSRRHHDLSDAVYMHSIISVVPSNYVRVYNGGIDVVSPFTVNIKAPSIKSEGDWTHTGSITASDDVVASGVSLVQHEHGGVARGGAMTSPPVAGVPGNNASFSAGSPAGVVL